MEDIIKVRDCRGEKIAVRLSNIRTVIRELKFFYIYKKDNRPATQCHVVIDDINQYKYLMEKWNV